MTTFVQGLWLGGGVRDEHCGIREYVGGSSVGLGDGLGVVNVQGVDSVAVRADAVVLSATIPAASVLMPEQEIHSSTRSSGRNAKRRTSDAGGQGGSEALKKIKIVPLMKAR
ncbi:hypothetical protein C8J56DRAFT_1040460 [Mycena floridula]|nr:hypothetical protein C8J56DRAFT_1040460 [Mycena floridula]